MLINHALVNLSVISRIECKTLIRIFGNKPLKILKVFWYCCFVNFPGAGFSAEVDILSLCTKFLFSLSCGASVDSHLRHLCPSTQNDLCVLRLQ